MDPMGVRNASLDRRHAVLTERNDSLFQGIAFILLVPPAAKKVHVAQSVGEDLVGKALLRWMQHCPSYRSSVFPWQNLVLTVRIDWPQFLPAIRSDGLLCHQADSRVDCLLKYAIRHALLQV